MRYRPGDPHFYITDAYGHPIGTDDIRVWGEFFEDINNRRVAETYVTPEVRVSTVFLGIDHSFGRDGPPLLWESMVFGGPLDDEQYRYDSREAAVTGHALLVERVRAALAATKVV